MNYYALGAAICLATLAISFAAASAVCTAVEAAIVRFAKSRRLEARARIVFACRIVPPLGALAVTFGVVLPSFVALEPLRTDEAIGWRLGILAAIATVLCSVVALRILAAWIAGFRLTRRWTRQATSLATPAGFRVYEIPNAGGLVATTGILCSRVFVSSDVVGVLTAAELSAAVAHERAHIRSFDNCKRLLLRALRLPFAPGDAIWNAACEVDADLAALQLGTPVLDLASALVKVARFRHPVLPDACAASCLIPAGHESALADRLRRLAALVDSGHQPLPRSISLTAIVSGFGIFAAFASAVFQPTVLRAAHELIERLV